MIRFQAKRGAGLRRWTGLPLAAATLLSVSGCVSGPTYGTGVGANTQLANDMSSIFTITPKSKPRIAYEPRPELVRPGAAERAASLPSPQQKLARADNPEWPESPEARRARLRAAATANQNNPDYSPEIVADGSYTGRSGPAQPVDRSPRAGEGAYEAGKLVSYNDNKRQREEFNKRLKESRQGDPNVRRYLSDPPLAYRQPADTAPTDDVGEDEAKKEKRLKAEAKAKSGKKGGWFDWLPGV